MVGLNGEQEQPGKRCHPLWHPWAPAAWKKMFIAVAVDEILKLEVLPQILFVKAIMGVDCTVIEYIMVYNEQRWP